MDNLPGCQRYLATREVSNVGLTCSYHAVMVQFDLDIGDKETRGNTMPRLREMTFNMSTGEATSRQVADTVCDFPRVPLNLVGERHIVPVPSSRLATYLHLCAVINL